MKYLKTFETYKPLLDLVDNVDNDLIYKIKNILPIGNILEISCGNGADAIELKKSGYEVTCTDNNEYYVNHVGKYVNSILHDTRGTFPFRDNEFDLVFSRLGLHYFSMEELDNIFKEINRLSKKFLVFSVKLENDNLSNTKVIISEKDWVNIVEKYFGIKSKEIKEGILYGSPSKWLEIVAEKQ
jgi:ubiquinone/menaquinone biosynthesis C-methylase UbiE